MYCTNCGREIIDTARFCNFCGAPVKNMTTGGYAQPVRQTQPIYPQQPMRTAQSAPVQTEPVQSVPVQSEPVQPAPVWSEPTDAPEPAVSEEVAGGEAAETAEDVTDIAFDGNVVTSDEAAAETDGLSEPARPERPSDSVFPRPNVIPTAGESASSNYVPPSYPNVPVVPAAPVVPVQSAVPEARPERKYTFGHIMMCLAAVAVMAIVAGVFAGLYFSVV